MIDWFALEGSGAAAADRKQLGDSSLGPLAAPDALKAFPKGFGDRAGHGFAGLLGECLGELWASASLMFSDMAPLVSSSVDYLLAVFNQLNARDVKPGF